MNVTIFPTGKGGAESAVRYLLSDTVLISMQSEPTNSISI